MTAHHVERAGEKRLAR
jgi:hypothetical protein